MPSPRLAPEGLGPTITVGEILVEIMATNRGSGFLEPQTLTGPYPSGAPAIFISQVAKLGGSAGIIACVGNDDFGTLNIERLRRDGADVSAIEVDPTFPTGTAFVRYRQDGGRDFVYNINELAAGKVRLTAAARALADRAGHLHVMGTALSIGGAGDIIDYAAKAVKARGGSISFDPNMRKELLTVGDIGARFSDLVGLADLLLPSGEELFAAAGVEGETAALAALFARGIGEVVVKRGANGSSWFGSGAVGVDCAAFKVEEVDPTGAGDCFGAAYLTCRRKGLDPQQALTYANAAGARNVTRQGPMEGVGSFRELDALIGQTPRR